MFASKHTDSITLDGVTVQLRKLSARQLENAAEVHQLEFAKFAKALSGDILKALRDPEAIAEAKAEEDETPEGLQARHEARYPLYDRFTVVSYGIEAWDAKEDGKALDLKKGIEDLDAEAAEKIKRKLLDMSLPPLGAAAKAAESKD